MSEGQPSTTGYTHFPVESQIIRVHYKYLSFEMFYLLLYLYLSRYTSNFPRHNQSVREASSFNPGLAVLFAAV